MEVGAGVYGLNVLGLGGASTYTGEPLADSPVLEVRQLEGEAPSGLESRLYDDRAVMPLLENGFLEVTREPAIATFTMPRTLSDDELLHPWLVPAAATVNAWHGRRVLHGGIVSDGQRALAIVGAKEGGKSTLLAWLALEAGLAVMGDDLVVFDGNVVFAGPRCIDLRPSSVPRLPDVPGAKVVRDGTRLRLPLPGTPGTAELIGIVVLEWATDSAVDAVRPADRLGEILPHALTEGIPLGAAGVLGFAKYQMWRLSRPKDWNSLPGSAQLLQRLLAE
jgi:hypothetical protein